MSDTFLTQKEVIGIHDIINGCGLGASLKEALVTNITLSTDLSATFSSRKLDLSTAFGSSNHIAIRVSPTIAFEAGYEINAQYILRSKSSNVDISSMESVIDYIENGEFNIEIEYTHPDENYNDNWSIKVYEEDLLNEITELAGEGDFDEEDDFADGGYFINEAFSFSCEAACEELSEDLLFSLTPTYSVKTHGITEDFAQHVHDELRKSAVEFYKKLINK